MKPNFFILGAPKCGTTAMNDYLSTHPNVWMSNPKEPGFWAKDYPDAAASQPIPLDTVDDYEKLFASAGPEHLVVGEATALYLSSDLAIESILTYRPDAKFLVMLRNPVDFVPAFHNEMLLRLRENVVDVEDAWSRIEARSSGRDIPASCKEPKLLNYRRMAAFGTQVSRAKRQIPEEQLMIVLLDDLKSDPRGLYLQVLQFLGIDDDGRIEFPQVKARRSARFRLLNQLYFHQEGLLGNAVKLTRRLGKRVKPMQAAWKKIRSKPQKSVGLSNAFRQELADSLEPEIVLLEQMLARDLSSWRDSNQMN